MAVPLAPNQVAARLDRLPVGRFHYRFLAMIALGAWFDYYDNFVAASLAVILPRAGVLPPTQPGEWISAVGLFTATLPLGMFLGSLFFGIASDYLGRRFAFVAMLLVYSLATLAGGAGYYPLTAVAGTWAGLVLLFVSRVIAGAGIGAENVIIDAYISEVMPRQIRGRAIALAHAVAFTALPVAGLLARLLAPEESPQGWWLLLVIGSAGALFTWYFRRRLPESPRWSATVGRHEQAAAALTAIEAEVERQTGCTLAPVMVPAHEQVTRSPFWEIWSSRYRGRTMMLVMFHLLQTVGYYGFMHWLVYLAQQKGLRHNEALTLNVVACVLAPVGPLLGAWSSERWQRKWLIVVLALAIAAGQLLFGYLASESIILLALTASAVVVGLNWFSAVFHAYQAELFPTEARATGVGFTYAWSRISMVGLNVIMPGLITTSLSAAFALMAIALFGVAVIIALFGPLTNSRALEDVSPQGA
jgi:putative MFS transporter